MTQTRHEANPEFVARLENELTQEYRRRERLGPIDRPRRIRGKWLRGAGLAVAGALLGAACATVPQHFENARSAELLLRIAAGRAELSRQIADQAEQRAEAGVGSVEAVYPARKDAIEARLQLALAELDVEEIQASGRPVRKDIAAPRIGGHDFVSERFQRELDANSEQAARLQEIIEFMDVRVRAGVDVQGSVLAFTQERDELAATAAQIRNELKLRQSFLHGDIGAEEADLQHRLLLATTRMQVAETRLDGLQAENDRVQRRAAAGVASPSESSNAQTELERAEAESQIATLEVDLINAELGRL